MATVDELRAKVTEKGPWFTVPHGTPEADCSRCDADELYWIVTQKGKKMLVDCGVKGGAAPSKNRLIVASGDELRDGRGVSHYATCPAAASFRR